jgi:hypothetical protein
MRGREMHEGFWWESQEERDHKDDLDVVNGEIVPVLN